jgi:ATP-binding cassette, subfamily B, bacterial PglK
MYKSLKDLYFVLRPEHKRKLIQIQFFIFCMALAELLTVFSIVPFMALITDPSALSDNNYIALFLDFFQIQDSPDLLIYIGLAVIAVISIASIISIGTVWLINIYASKIGLEISSILYGNYMNESWAFHSNNHSSRLNNKIMNEAARLTSHVITPILQVNARAVVILFIILGITIVSPVIALTSLTIFSAIYFLIFRFIKNRLNTNGVTLTNEQESRIKLIHDGFGGIKDTLILGRQHYFVERFATASEKVAIAGAINQALTQTPRYFLEFLAFSGLILIVLSFHALNNGNISAALPIISLFAIAAFKILPALQILYSSLSMIQGNISALDSIKLDLEKNSTSSFRINTRSPQKNFFTKNIILEDITFGYSSNQNLALDGINIEIPKNNKIAIVGASGSGKSTLLDIFLCLVQPDFGRIVIDDKELTKENIRDFQNNIGFVPQTPFLSDSSILSNIAFGLPNDQIDMDAVTKAIKLAKLNDFIASLPKGINSFVGERGVQISGGQKQRISIARALYNNPSILVFDEATSALDGNTEADVMKEINSLSLQKTIVIVAHRLSTVKLCERIYFLSDGNLVDSGTYQELFSTNKDFREMANNS